MELQEVMETECIRTGGSAGSKDEVLKEVAELAARSSALAGFSAKKLYKELAAREEQGTTGFERGIAIPHCSLKGLERFVVGAVTYPDGVDFDATDGNPSKLVFFIIGPEFQRNLHVQLLAAISKVVKVPNAVETLISSTSPDELRDRIVDYVEFGGERPKGEESSATALIHVYVQREELFEDILELFSAASVGSVAVSELNNAGHYLHRIPLFASLWSEDTRQTIHHIEAVVRRAQTNDLVRKIHLLEDGIFERSGVLVAVQDLNFVTGSIDF
jgi:PTS system nitrogen regulatory IIA component